jgi:hypothetical protein
MFRTSICWVSEVTAVTSLVWNETLTAAGASWL